MFLRRSLTLLLGVSLAAAAQIATPRVKPPKKEKEPETQALPLPPEPPAAVVAETGKLVFHLSPLSNKGLLTQQVRDAIKALDRASGGAAMVKLRAFVAGTGDMRRVATIVSEELSDKKLPLPAVTTIQVGALPMEGAQVVIESISAEKKTVNPNGLAFFSGHHAVDASQAVAQLAGAAASAGASMLAVTCFLSTLDQADSARAATSAAFPGAAVNFVQPTRLAVAPEAACEGVGRLNQPGKSPVGILDGAATVARPKLVFTGIQMAFGDQEQDLRLAFERLGRALEAVKARNTDTLETSIYSPDRVVTGKMAALAKQFLGASTRAVSSTQIIEGLPSLDATVAIEVIAAGP